ncbi:MAG: Trm112 family protein [Candidatus Njordarchaeia archaeon]
MRYKTLKLLKCPKCGGNLKIETVKEGKQKHVIIKGLLTCSSCNSTFRIEEGIISMENINIEK